MLGHALAAGGGDGGEVGVLLQQDADLVAAGLGGVGAQGGLHLDDGDVQALVRQVEGGLAAHLAAADDHHLVAQLVLAAVGVGGHNAVVGVEAGQGEHQGLGTHGDQHRVKLAAEHLGGGLAVQLHVDGPLAHLVDQIVLVGTQGILELHILGELQGAAQVILLLEQGDLMAPVEGGDGGLHAGGAAADDGHPLDPGGGGGEHLLPAGLVAHQGVDGAAEQVLIAVGVVAAHALDAGYHVVGPAVDGLFDGLRVGDQLAGHGEEVALALGDGVLGGLQALQAAHCGDRLVDFARLFEGLGQPQVGMIAHVLAGMGPGHVLLGDHAAGGLDDVAVILEDGGDADALLQVDAALGKLGGGHAHLKGHAAPGGLPAGVQNLHQIAAAVLGGAAILVGAAVGQGREELGHGDGVAEVEEQAVKAAHLQVGAHLSGGLLIALHFLHGDLLGDRGGLHHPVAGRAAQRRAGTPGGGQQAHDLHARQGPVGVDPGSQQGQAVLVVEGHGVPGAVLAVVHHVHRLGAAAVDHCRAGLGPVLEVSHGVLVGIELAVAGGVGGDGGGDDAVLKQYSVDPYRGEHMGKLLIHFHSPQTQNLIGYAG